MAYQRPGIKDLLKQHFFTIGILVCIILAEIAPFIGAQGGPLYPEVTVKFLAVSVIFYTSGLALKWQDLSKAATQLKLHVFIQAVSFVFIPIFIQAFLYLYGSVFYLNTWIHKGLVIVGCMPPPVSSAVILTRSTGGNEAAAILNSALGSILGIIVTPLLLLVYINITSTLPVLRTCLQLSQTMILPMVLGQISQRLIPKEVLAQIPFSIFGQISLLFIIYTSFCDMFNQEDYSFEAKTFLVTLLLVFLIQITVMLLVFQISNVFRKNKNIYSAQDVIAITFCSTHKSLTLGMPLLKTLYSGYSHLSQISLPLLVYHPVQLILGGFVVPYGKKWLKKHSRSSSIYKRP